MTDLSNENVIHVKKDNIQYLQFKRLLEYKEKLSHCYTLKPIDIKQKTKDDENYRLICDALSLDNKNVVIPNQTHTNNVAIVKKESTSDEFINIDGLITNEKDKVLAASFADCTSLFFYDPKNNAIGNIHSGWRGTVKRIGEVAINKMVQEYGTNPSDLICCIGPTIRNCHFEVEDDVKTIFENTFRNSKIIEGHGVIDGKNKYHIDAVKAITEMLLDCGLKSENIIDSGICTVCYNNLLHSYRSEKENARKKCVYYVSDIE